MPERIVREELEALGIRVQRAMQLRSGRRDQNVSKEQTPTPHFVGVGGERARHPESAISILTLRLKNLSGDIYGSKGPATK